MSNWQEVEKIYYLKTGNRVPVTLVKGKGARAWDDAGKEYLDFVSGWAVNSLGHCHPALVKAVTEQVNTLVQTSNQFYTVPQLQLAQLLVENSCLDKVYVCNSGAEACEGAVKLARRYGSLKLNGAYEVITALNSFHGRTLAMTAATGQGAVMLEPLQGEGGVNVPDDNYLASVRSWCDEKGILLILDEIQTGIGRLGTLFAYEQSNVEPDIMALAKGLGGGVPVGAFMAKDKVCVFSPGEHGSTFGGNPLTCAAACATVSHIIENDVTGNVRKVGQYFFNSLKELQRKYPFITDVRGRGLLLAIQFDREIGQDMLNACLENGMLVNCVKPNALRFMPPLIIGNSDVDEALGILDKSLSGISS